MAEHARVAESTARDHLDRLHEMGVVTARDVGESRYRPDPAYVRFREIRELAAAHDTEELSQFVLELREATDEIRDEHDSGSPAELRAAAAGDDVSTERARERLRAADDWEHYAYRLSLIEDALARYDEFQTDSPAPA